MSADRVELAVARREGLTVNRGAGSARKTRMRKAECSCGYTVRISRRWIARGLPDCPVCRVPLECRDLDDAMHDPAQSERLVEAFGDAEYGAEQRRKAAQPGMLGVRV